MKNNTIFFISFIIGFIVACLLWYGKTTPNVDRVDTVFSTKTDTLWKDTTIIKKEQVPKKVYITKIDTFYTKEGNDTIFETENKIYNDTLTCKNDSIILLSYISGINSNLDSIKADWRKSETIVTNTVEITKIINKKKTFWDRLHFGIQGGYGYAFKSRELTPYIGFGGSLDL